MVDKGSPPPGNVTLVWFAVGGLWLVDSTETPLTWTVVDWS